MGDPLKKVHPGDHLRIPAATYNRRMGVALDHLAYKRNAAARRIGQPGPALGILG